MRNLLRGVILSLGLWLGAPSLAEPPADRADLIRERLVNANAWRDHVMVVAHRGGGLAGGKRLYPENSRASVKAAIRAGAEIVEIDIQKSRDGVYVVLHDSFLDRTTDCRGPLASFDLAALRRCRLKVEGTGEITAETVPTLEEMLAETRGRILVNIDNKMAESEIAGITWLAGRKGMADELVVKQNLWNAARIGEAQALMRRAASGTLFMPIVADDAVHDAAFLAAATKPFAAPAAELIAWRRPGAGMTPDGGLLFAPKARALAARGNFHLWVNTYAIVNKDGGWLAGGRGDELAFEADLPEESLGFWVARGATIVQTDEPQAAIRWLAAQGLRAPYADEAQDYAAMN